MTRPVFQQCLTTPEPLGGLESGAAASLADSIRVAILSGGVLCLAGAAGVTAVLPALWRYDSSAGPAAEPARAGDPAIPAEPADT